MENERCSCGHVILADTEDWATPLCYGCYTDRRVEEYVAECPEDKNVVDKFWKWIKEV